MKINMTLDHVCSIAQIQELIKIEKSVKFEVDKKGNKNKQEMYDWISETLTKLKYFSIKKKDKSEVMKYIHMTTSLSSPQIKKLIVRKRNTGHIKLIEGDRNKFPEKYSVSDIQRLVETDNAHERLSGDATKRILEREYEVYHKVNYEIISHISVSHIYNIRNNKKQYISNSLTIAHTKATQISIGIRKKPNNQGMPGFVRVDSVHQGDLDKEKGVYHINLVDEVTQWEIVATVEGISENFLLPILKDMLEACPFIILGFHSDNGSEYINKLVSKLLQSLLIEQTKSRARHSGDNGLVETKNGSIIRKHFGHSHIPRKYAEYIQTFNQKYFNSYLNYHRPCGFATDIIDKRGKVKKLYDVYMTPYEKLKSLPNYRQYLKSNIQASQLEGLSLEQSDNEFALLMQKAKRELLEKLRKLQS